MSQLNTSITAHTIHHRDTCTRTHCFILILFHLSSSPAMKCEIGVFSSFFGSKFGYKEIPQKKIIKGLVTYLYKDSFPSNVNRRQIPCSATTVETVIF